jgi:hypothetical protein
VLLPRVAPKSLLTAAAAVAAARTKMGRVMGRRRRAPNQPVAVLVQVQRAAVGMQHQELQLQQHSYTHKIHRYASWLKVCRVTICQQFLLAALVGIPVGRAFPHYPNSLTHKKCR